MNKGQGFAMGAALAIALLLRPAGSPKLRPQTVSNVIQDPLYSHDDLLNQLRQVLDCQAEANLLISLSVR
jgi:hypothetical protein